MIQAGCGLLASEASNAVLALEEKEPRDPLQTTGEVSNATRGKVSAYISGGARVKREHMLTAVLE